jgi:thioredoxin 1
MAVLNITNQAEFNDKVLKSTQPQIAGQYNVMGIPTMVVLKEGQEVNRIVGFRPRKDIMAALDAVK